MTQQPAFFGDCLVEVPVNGLIRFPLLANGQEAIPEIGSPLDPPVVHARALVPLALPLRR